MDELTWVYGTVALMVGTFAYHVLTKRFDPFAPIWLFFVGYVQIYVVQAISYHDWAVRVRGVDLVASANCRAFWALAWFLLVYHCGPGRALAKALPKAPRSWSTAPIVALCPLLLVWGLYCSGVVLRGGEEDSEKSAEATLFQSFPFVMMVAGSLLIVTGRQASKPSPALTAAGVTISTLYLLIWMFNGKRSHSLFAVLVGVCSYYVPRFKRPSFPTLMMTAAAGLMAVGISIGWRFNMHARGAHGSYADFFEFVANFDPSTILDSMNVTEKKGKDGVEMSYETEEIGGYYLMKDTVPEKADYDYGLNYLRVFSTYIPRIVWADKPIFGRDKWIAAWVAGSEFKRDSTFAGPAIGLLGATHLNGGAVATFLVLGVIALVFSTFYAYFRLHAGSPWAQASWALWYFNAWLMVVNDDPCIWFYYNFGFTTLPTLVLLWFVNKSGDVQRS